MQKPQIQYPCEWYYKIIGSDRELIIDTLSVVLKGFTYQFNESRQSRTGKYISFHVSLRVSSEEERNKIFLMLKDIPTVRVVF